MRTLALQCVTFGLKVGQNQERFDFLTAVQAP